MGLVDKQGSAEAITTHQANVVLPKGISKDRFWHIPFHKSDLIIKVGSASIMDNLVIASCRAGLGNRLKCLLSAMRLSPEVRIIWPKWRSVKAPFKYYFENDLEIEQAPKGAEIYRNWNFIVLPGDNWAEIRALSPLHDVAPSKAQGVYLEDMYDQMPQRIRDAFVAAARILKVEAGVQSIVDMVLAQLPSSYIGVHIRTWDDDSRKAVTYRIDSYLEAMRRFSGHTFLVCSDSVKCIQTVKAIFGGRALSREDFLMTDRGLLKEQWALVDMLLLGNAEEMIVTEASTFTEAGWFLSGARARVHVVRPTKEGYIALANYRRPQE